MNSELLPPSSDARRTSTDDCINLVPNPTYDLAVVVGDGAPEDPVGTSVPELKLTPV